MMQEFKRTTNGFNYIYERTVEAGETIYLKMPTISPNKRGINDIGWAASDDITLYASINKNPLDEDAVWQEILVDDEINKTTTAIKIVNSGESRGFVIIRAILN